MIAMLSAADARRGAWIQTFTGRQFWPLDPRADDIDIRDIAHALSNLCRFTGHTRLFYSVAEHSVRVSREVERVLRWAGLAEAQGRAGALAALLHDASEAYLVDVPRPVKRTLPEYRAAEAILEEVILVRFGLVVGPELHDVIKAADDVLLATEARDLMGPRPAPWSPMPNPLLERIEPWAPELAENQFLCRFVALGGELEDAELDAEAARAARGEVAHG